MMNSNIPVDASRFGTLRLGGCAPKKKYGSEEQMCDKNGVPLYDVHLLGRMAKANGSQSIKVVVASNSDPVAGIELDAPVKVENMRLSFGQLDDAGRRLWSKFTADKIAPAK